VKNIATDRVLYIVDVNDMNTFLKNTQDALFDGERAHLMEKMLFVGMTLLYLLPIWAFQYFPSQDGPTHIYNATIIHEFFHPEYSIFQQFYELNTHPDPTWFGHLILTLLLYVFDPEITEKLFLTFYVVMLVLSVRYALGVINPNSRWLAYLAFPLIYSYILYLGFYSFSMSYAMSFFVIGYWLQHSNTWRVGNLAFFGILVFLLYLFHIVSLVMTLGILGVFAVYSIYFECKSERSIANRSTICIRSAKNYIFYPLLSLIPTLIVAGMFLQSRESVYQPGMDFLSRMEAFVSLHFVVSFQFFEKYKLALLYTLPILLLLTLFLAPKIKQRDLQNYDMLLIAAFACTIVYFLAPETYLISPNGLMGGGYMVARINAFPFFLIILWFASQNFSGLAKKISFVFSILFSLSLLIINVQKTGVINEQINEYLSAMEYIEENTTLLSLNMDRNGYDKGLKQLTRRTDPFLHVSSHIGMQRHVVIMTNYEAATGYFPVLFKTEVNPYALIGEIERPWLEPVNFQDYEKNTGRRIDYVLVWLGLKRHMKTEFSRSVYDQLEINYEQIFISKNELMELYRLKNDRF
jgi:hypothetical protein